MSKTNTQGPYTWDRYFDDRFAATDGGRNASWQVGMGAIQDKGPRPEGTVQDAWTAFGGARERDRDRRNTEAEAARTAAAQAQQDESRRSAASKMVRRQAGAGMISFNADPEKAGFIG